MKKYIATLLAGAALLGGCKDSTGVPDFNNPSYQDLLAKPLTVVTLQNLITGLVDQERAALGTAPATYIVFPEVLARDAYRTDQSEPRYVNEFLNGTPDPGAFSGNGAYLSFTRDVRAANTLLALIPSAAPSELTDAQKSATRGFTRTMKALDVYHILETRDSLGVAIDVDKPLGEALAPMVCKPKVLAYISALLDTAYTDLQAGGSAFPFKLPPGFNGFTAPATTFAQFNRGLKGKIELYRALDHTTPTGATGFNAAITALNASFINSTDASKITTGVYYTYSIATGDRINPLVDGNLHLNPQISDSLQAGDARGAKIVTLADPSTIQGVTYKSNFAATQIQPIAMMKNEELVLLRAQAKVGLNDLAGATQDVNYVRGAWGLGPVATFATANDAIHQILWEKRYSLLFESAHRLVDLRAYGRLNNSFFKKELPGDVFVKALPHPQNEADQRAGNLAVSCS
jgi:hypothetical protein